MGSSVALTQDVALRDNNDMPSRKLLLQFTNKTGLNLVEGLLELVRDVNDDGLAAGGAVDFLGGGDVEIAEGCLQFGRGHFEVE